MFTRLLRPSTTNAVLASATAAVAGSAVFASQKESSDHVTECADNTVVGMLQGIQQKVSNIEAVLGTVEKPPPPARKHGIDIVLGAQWGDEGKGKLVDMLSQVCVFSFVCLFVCFSMDKESLPTLRLFRVTMNFSPPHFLMFRIVKFRMM